jgi:hypothetical protein
LSEWLRKPGMIAIADDSKSVACPRLTRNVNVMPRPSARMGLHASIWSYRQGRRQCLGNGSRWWFYAPRGTVITHGMSRPPAAHPLCASKPTKTYLKPTNKWSRLTTPRPASVAEAACTGLVIWFTSAKPVTKKAFTSLHLYIPPGRRP